MRIAARAFAVLAWLVMASNSSLADDPAPAPVADRNAFAFDLLSRLAPASTSENVLVSPLGVTRILAMAAEGAAGATAEEIRQVGRLPVSSRDLAAIDPSRPSRRPVLDARLAANDGYGLKVESVTAGSPAEQAGLQAGDLLLALNNRPIRALDRLADALDKSGDGPARLQVYSFGSGMVEERDVTLGRAEVPSSFVVRDAAFLQTGLTVRPEFRAGIDASFHAPIDAVDFAANPVGAATEIDRWARSSGSQAPLPDPASVDRSTRLVLADVIAFEAEWLHKFPPGSPGRFTRADGSANEVPMLERTGSYAIHVEDDGSGLLEIPYADRVSSMILALPPVGKSVRETLASWKSEGFERRRARLKSRRVEVRMPKFRVESSRRLNDPLIAMGMRSAFGRDADFSAIAMKQTGHAEVLGLAAIVQSAWLDVNERGTRAGALTSAAVVSLDAQDEPAKFHADRPFAFFLLDRRTGLIAFAGIVEDPGRTGMASFSN